MRMGMIYVVAWACLLVSCRGLGGGGQNVSQLQEIYDEEYVLKLARWYKTSRGGFTYHFEMCTRVKLEHAQCVEALAGNKAGNKKEVGFTIIPAVEKDLSQQEKRELSRIATVLRDFNAEGLPGGQGVVVHKSLFKPRQFARWPGIGIVVLTAQEVTLQYLKLVEGQPMTAAETQKHEQGRAGVEDQLQVIMKHSSAIMDAWGEERKAVLSVKEVLKSLAEYLHAQTEGTSGLQVDRYCYLVPKDGVYVRECQAVGS